MAITLPAQEHRSRTAEPVVDLDDVQGNLVPGFNKDHAMLLLLRVDDADAARGWLGGLLPDVATGAEVLAFNRLFARLRRRRGREGTVRATWLNVAISAAGLTALGVDVRGFADEAFRAGLAERSPLLGDPVEPGVSGHPSTWVFGGPHRPVHLVLIIAADDADDLLDEVDRIEQSIYAAPGPGSGVSLVGKQAGATLPEPRRGHEHFGFRDGVSQPGLRGQTRRGAELTERLVPGDPDVGKPGQDLLWPGEFLFGYPRQDPADDRRAGADSMLRRDGTGPAVPELARNGAYVVLRRLRQDVAAFHAFCRDTGAAHDVPPDVMGSRFVGRWASGAPVSRSPRADDPALAADELANNDFEFAEASRKRPGSRFRRPRPTRPAAAARSRRTSGRATPATTPTLAGSTRPAPTPAGCCAAASRTGRRRRPRPAHPSTTGSTAGCCSSPR